MRAHSIILGFSLLFVLSGCETWQVLTFSPDNLSHKDSDHVELALQPPGIDPTQNLCVPPTPQQGKEVLLPAFAGAVIIGAIDIATSVGGDALASYLDKKQKEFTSEFAAQDTKDSLITYSAQMPQLTFNCIVVKQVMKDKDKNGNNKTGFYFVGSIQTSSNFNATQIVPISYTLGESSAKTDESGKVDVDLRIQIKSIIADKDGVLSEKVIDDQTIHFPAMQLPDGVPQDKPTAPLKPAWFALPSLKSGSGSQTTVAIDVTENGTGSPNYAAAKSEISDGLKNAGTDLGKVITSVTQKSQ